MMMMKSNTAKTAIKKKKKKLSQFCAEALVLWYQKRDLCTFEPSPWLTRWRGNNRRAATDPDTRLRWWKCHRLQLKAVALNKGRAGWVLAHDAWFCVRCKDVLAGPRREEEPSRSESSEAQNETGPVCPSRCIWWRLVAQQRDFPAL